MSRLCSVFWRRHSVDNSMAVITLNDLSDYDLLTLMERLPLQDLLRLAAVSRRFNVLAKRRQPDRRHLVIGIGSTPKLFALSRRYQNVIVIRTLTASLIDRILAYLPGVTDLVIIQDSAVSANLEAIIVLLEKLSTQLKSLYLHFLKAFDQPTSQQPLFAAINGLTKLARLNLSYQSGQIFIATEPAIVHLPIISQLTHFEFNCNTKVGPLLLELIQRATATATPPQINFRAHFDAYSLELLQGIPSTLAKRFTALSVVSSFANSTDLTNICDNFSNLTSFGFNANHLTIGQIAGNLAKLTHLTSFNWRVNFINRVQWRQEEVTLRHFGELPEPDIQDSSELVPLQKVTELVLMLNIAKHNDLALLHLATLFPNVTSLDLVINSCVQCGFGSSEQGTRSSIAKSRCSVKLVNYWLVFPKLVKLKEEHAIVPSFLWKPLPFLGVSLFYLNYAFEKILFEPMGKIVGQCRSWITNMFTSD